MRRILCLMLRLITPISKALELLVLLLETLHQSEVTVLCLISKSSRNLLFIINLFWKTLRLDLLQGNNSSKERLIRTWLYLFFVWLLLELILPIVLWLLFSHQLCKSMVLELFGLVLLLLVIHWYKLLLEGT